LAHESDLCYWIQVTTHSTIPRHVAIIMDGNGRWAERQRLPRIEGHRQGAQSVREVTRAARRVGIERLTLYAFSEQNWGRPAPEVRALMGLLQDYLTTERAEILDNDIRLTTIGRVDKLPIYVRKPLEWLQEASAENSTMELCLALSYGGREALTEAVQRIVNRVQAGTLSAEQVNEDVITHELTGRDVDLVIRTSGEYRVSNFLLWESAYAEFYFTEKLWPEFGEADLMDALGAFQRRERRFGLVA